MPTKRTNFI